MIAIIRREIDRALASVRPAFRGVMTRWQFRQSGANLAQGEGLSGEPLQALEFFQHAGFISGVPAGAQLIVLPLGGKTAHAIVIASEYGAYKLSIAEGEVALHHLSEPDCYVHLKAGRIVEVRCDTFRVNADTLIEMTALQINATASTGIDLDTPTVHASNDIVADNDIKDQAGEYSMEGMRTIFDDHDHPENDDGGPTDPPNQKMSD